MPETRDAFWWEGTRESALGRNSGWIAKPKGQNSPIPCPKCKDGFIVYNGNYFCSEWAYHGEGVPLEEGECDWALAHPATTKKDREICDLIGLDYN